MIILKKLSFILIFFFLSAMVAGGQSNSPQWASIKAFLPRWEGADITITINKKPVFLGKVVSGMVSFNYQLSGTMDASLLVKKEKSLHLFFYAEPGVIRITDDGRVLRAFGTVNNDRYSKLESELDSLARIETNGTAVAVKQMKRERIAELLLKEPSSLVSLRMLYQYFYGERKSSDTVYYRLYHSLSAEVRSTPLGTMIGEEVNARYRIAIGREAQPLLLPDVNRTLQPVFQKGQYTLIHFWASWCQPCRKMNVSLKELYTEMPADVLTMVGISMDANFSAWTNAIAKEKLSWKQLSDLRGWKSEVTNSYSVESIPANILVDPNGIIIARNVSADDLRKLIPAQVQKTF